MRISGDVGDPGSRSPGRTRLALEAALVLLAVLAYLWPFRLYGFDLVDEGTQLAQIERVREGERPYLDFETGYTPGYFHLHAALWRATGEGLVTTRTFGVLLQAGTAALVFALARGLAGGLVATSLVLLQVAFLLPVSLRAGAPFNVPYPGWIAAPLALAAQALVGALVASRCMAWGADGKADRSPSGDRGRRSPPRAAGWLVAAGLAAGAAFSVKPNSGLLALGGAALGSAVGWAAGAGAVRSLARAVGGAAAVGALVLLRGGLDPGTSAALLLPALLAGLWLGPAGRPPSSGEGPTPGMALGDLLCLAVGFVVPVLPWFVPLAAEVGLPAALRAVLLLDGDVVGAYGVAYPAPSPATLCLAMGTAAAAWCATRDGATTRTGVGRSPATAAPGLLLAGLAAAFAFAVAGGQGARATAENAVLWLGPVALLAGLATAPAPAAGRRERALLCFAAMYSLQLFPRPDLNHVALGAPPLLLAVAATWSRLTAAWRRGAGDGMAARGARPRAAAVAFAIVVALALGRALPAFAARLRGPLVPLDAGVRAPVWILATHADETRWLGEAVRAIERHSDPGDAVFPFPDLAGLGFLAGRRMPFHEIYFVPGWPDRAAEPRIVARLEAVRPSLAVIGPAFAPLFVGSRGYFGAIEGYIAGHYEPVAKAGACTILRRR